MASFTLSPRPPHAHHQCSKDAASTTTATKIEASDELNQRQRAHEVPEPSTRFKDQSQTVSSALMLYKLETSAEASLNNATEEEEKRRRQEQATEARRYRRQALRRKSKPLTVTKETLFHEGHSDATGTTYNEDTTTTASSPFVVQTIQRKPLFAEKRHRFDQPLLHSSGSENSMNTTTTPAVMVLHSDLTGIREIAQLLVQSSLSVVSSVESHRSSATVVVAVPTECTYEALFVHDYMQNNDQQQQRQHELSPVESVSASPPRHVYFLDWTALDSSRFWKPLLPKRSYAIRQSTPRLGTTSISPHRQRPSSSRTKQRSATIGCVLDRGGDGSFFGSGDTSASHKWSPVLRPVTSHHALSSHFANNRVGSVGGSSSSSTTTTIAHFNESVQIIRRIAPKIWPGPMLVHVQVPCQIPGLTMTVPSIDSSSSDKNLYFVALRKPCHPLMVKVCQEFYSMMSANKQPFSPHPRKSMITPSPNATPPQPPCHSSSDVNQPAMSPLSLTATAFETVQTVTPKMESLESSEYAATVTERAVRQRRRDPVLLVGTPMSHCSCTSFERSSFGSQGEAKSNQQCSTKSYITRAQQALSASTKSSLSPFCCLARRTNILCNGVTAILNGEEQREMFAVPTCEHGQPWPVSIWIEPSTRTVRLQSIVADDVLQPVGGSSSLSSLSNINEYMVQTKAAVAQAIRTPPPPSAKNLTVSPHGSDRSSMMSNSKERIVQAAMLQWNVVVNSSVN